MNDRTEDEAALRMLAERYPYQNGGIIFHCPSDMAEQFVLRAWLRQVGDCVRIRDAVATIESQSWVLEIESYQEGILSECLFGCGDVVKPGRPSHESKMKNEPDKAMAPMRILVTDCADAHSSPSSRMAHHDIGQKT